MTKSEDFCSSCYLKDLCTLCSTSKKWYAATKEAMYQKIWVPLNDQPLQPRKLKLKSATQLKRLCRTLHKRPHLAVLVKELKISAQDRASLTVPTKDKESAFELLASLVAACPNLQRLTGFCPSYGHIADSLVIELHRATKLKEHTWIIGPKKLTPAQTIIQGSAPRGLPSPAQTTAFVSRHSGWSSLQTLVLGSDNGNLGTGAIYGTLRRLPSLKHLCISNFDARDFHDDTMHALPYLHSLRLENLPGLTDRGLSTLADRRVCRSLRRLTLLNLEFVSAPLAARILAAAPHLVKFALAQDRIPDLPFGAAFSAPFFASASLRFLHWDVPHPGPALDLLADSFRAGGLPALRRLRAPIDPSGVLQQLCQPRADIARSGDVALAAADLAAQNDGPEKRPQGALNIRKLSVARLAAQKRIEEARRVPAVRVVVEEEGVLRGSHTLRGYMGTLRSKVEYWLEPDVEGDDKAVGDVGELLRGSTMMGEEVCLGGVTGKKGGHGSRRMEKLVGSEILF
ncbi:MAG: hypothetical protein M1822_000988 [Bathelium mastoideum]|nr:MAG: hypothetical protein M1822_000988 [Bathelium mastoideum]